MGVEGSAKEGKEEMRRRVEKAGDESGWVSARCGAYDVRGSDAERTEGYEVL
jgi:hypothetical protein